MGVNRVSFTKRGRTARTAGGVILATSLLALGLVTAATSSSGAAPVSTEIEALCAGADAPSLATLNNFAGILGGNTIPVTLTATAPDIPESAAIGDKINAQFNWTGQLSQKLIDTAAGLGASIDAENISAQMTIKGPSDIASFSATAPNLTVVPAVGVPSVLSLGAIGGEITTTGGGIITYRVASVSFTTKLLAAGIPVVLNISCAPIGSNLITKTSVKDPDAPTFTPEIIPLATTAGGVATVDLLGGTPPIITPGKTPLIPESLKIVEAPTAGEATITNGVFSFTAPAQDGTYSTTVEICGVPKEDAGAPGVSEIQNLVLGDNWAPIGSYGLDKRPIAFSLKFGGEETPLIWASDNLGSPEPTPENWAPATGPGQVGRYADLFFGRSVYRGITAAQVQSALEGLPNVGAGNVEVVAEKNNADRPNLVTNFKINYQGALAEQDVPALSLGQWYSVLPQEALTRINESVQALIPAPATTVPGAPEPVDPLGGRTGQALNDFIVERIVTGTFTPEISAAFVKVVIIDPITAAAPALIAAINGLFPKVIDPVAVPVVGGESPTKAEPLCSQGIIDVTVTAGVLGISIENTGTQVAGTNDTQGLGFVG